MLTSFRHRVSWLLKLVQLNRDFNYFVSSWEYPGSREGSQEDDKQYFTVLIRVIIAKQNISVFKNSLKLQ